MVKPAPITARELTWEVGPPDLPFVILPDADVFLQQGRMALAAAGLPSR